MTALHGKSQDQAPGATESIEVLVGATSCQTTALFHEGECPHPPPHTRPCGPSEAANDQTAACGAASLWLQASPAQSCLVLSQPTPTTPGQPSTIMPASLHPLRAGTLSSQKHRTTGAGPQAAPTHVCKTSPLSWADSPFSHPETDNHREMQTQRTHKACNRIHEVPK